MNEDITMQEQRLSANFRLSELLRSQTARRQGGEMEKQQFQPDGLIVRNINYLVVTALQPLRTLLQTSITVNSGYRCTLLNQHIGGATKSQHMEGKAADLVLSGEIKTRGSRQRVKTIIENKVRQFTGVPLRADVNANFYLFAAAVLYREELDVDKLIHEFGADGEPDWVHLSCNREESGRRQLLAARKRNGKTVYDALSPREALMIGCERD